MIRGWEADDLPDLAALDRELFGADAWDVPAWRDLLAGPGRRAWVARDADDRLEGYALAGTVAEVTDLLRIGVRPRARRRGLATGLLATLLEAAAGDGAERVLLEVSEANAGAVAFYARHGFTRIDARPRYYRDGSTALVLARAVRLDPATHQAAHEAADPATDPVTGPGTVGGGEHPSGRMDP